LEVVFSTQEVHPRDRFDYWHSVACSNIADHASVADCRHSFEASLRCGTIGDIGLVQFENSAMAISRTRYHADKSASDDLLVCRQDAGSLALQQAGRELTLEAGTITLIDPRLPYEGKFSSGSRLLVFKIPRHLLEVRLGNARDIAALPLKPLNGKESLISSFLAMLAAHAGRLELTTENILQNQVVDLLASSFASALNKSSLPISSTRSLTCFRVRAAIEKHIVDPCLNTKRVAEAAGVSVRTANAALAGDNTSISRLLLERRLARCKAALGDLRQMHRTVSEIAYGWGFSDMTHFGRKFKAAFGMLPSEYRNLAKTKAAIALGR
jgi:AraC family transcriptional activator of tynA and feaB